MNTTNLDVLDVRPFIGAKDFDESRDFYVALGWRVTYESDDLRVLRLGDHSFYLQRYYQKDWCDNTMLHVSVRDVQSWFERTRSIFEGQSLPASARMSDSIRDEGYAMVFHVWDPAGVLVHFAQFSGDA